MSTRGVEFWEIFGFFVDFLVSEIHASSTSGVEFFSKIDDWWGFDQKIVLIFECAAMTAVAKLHFQSKVLGVAMASLHSFACFLPLQQRYKFLHQNTWHLEVAFQSGNSKKRKRIHLGGGTRAEGR